VKHGNLGREGEPLQGVFSIQHITYQNEETGYAVVHLVSADEPAADPIVAVGILEEAQEGACYRIEGVWRRDPRHGLQVQIASAIPEVPRSLAAIERYLAGASIKGLGPHYARRLVEHFGAGTYDELQQGGPHLQDVPGIGPSRARLIRDGWAEHQGIHDLMINLQGVAELTPSQAQRIYRQYGREAWMVLQRDPYRLAEEVRGFGFKTCDRIARRLGMDQGAPQRLQAGLVFLLQEALAEGHLWSAGSSLLEEASALLDAPPELLAPQVEALVEQGRIVREEVGEGEGAICGFYLPPAAHTEQRLAERIAFLLRRLPHVGLRLAEEEGRSLVERHAQRGLTDEQRQAVVSVLMGARIVILTGGPGTGKTTTVRSLLACLEALQVTFALCATTGRASKQLSASTGRQAATVHRHLGLGPRQDEIEPVHEAVLVIDESSMIDLWLMDQIVARLTEDTVLFLVGDVDQLPSVGPGAILQDLIAAGEQGQASRIAVVRLSAIFRQEAGDESMIVVNCHRIRAGQRPLRGKGASSDYFEMFCDTPQEARTLAVDLVVNRLPNYLHVPPVEVQVLAPMHAGEAGIRALNQALQQALNPAKPGQVELGLSGGTTSEAGRTLRVGDKVRQTQNNYQKQVFNGDLGTISRIVPQDRLLMVSYDERTVTYTFEELDQLVHAWAMTVHSAQGSQWPAVVIIMLTNQYVMLERNILYTALSRAQRLAVLISQEQAVRVAVAQGRSTRRRTNLQARLMRALAGPDTLDRPPLYTGRLFD
jgi:exodeoxyribonuclease V alpha subunit